MSATLAGPDLINRYNNGYIFSNNRLGLFGLDVF
jgi:hypothetical protein